MVGSITTHEPPLSSACGGMYTNTGWRKPRRASTMYAPNFSIWSYISERKMDKKHFLINLSIKKYLWDKSLSNAKDFLPFIPPEKPLQFANTMSGRRSRLKSLMAWAVLKAESGNHTWPACWRTWHFKRTQIQVNTATTHSVIIQIYNTTITFDSESRFAGSAGTVSSTVRVSTAMTPRGIPPNLLQVSRV